MVLAYAGCRLSEVLALTVDRVDFAAGVLVIESLKKRRSCIYRTVPVPLTLTTMLPLTTSFTRFVAIDGVGFTDVSCSASDFQYRGSGRVHANSVGLKLDPGTRVSSERSTERLNEIGFELPRQTEPCAELGK